MKRVISVVGARPNFMKVAPIHRAFARYRGPVEHLIVHTGQHYDRAMSKVFFEDLELPNPDFYLGVGSGSHADQTARVMLEFEKIVVAEKPDMVVVVGDVNSTLACSLVAVKLGVPVAHVEAGLRSFDRSMPEEINRIVTDAVSSLLFVSEPSGVVNLKREGVAHEKIHLVGNVMIDSLVQYRERARSSTASRDCGVDGRPFVLVTLHRPSNVDGKENLEKVLGVLEELSNEAAVLFPIHPRTRKMIAEFGLQAWVDSHPKIRLVDPLGYLDFLSLMERAKLVITDSGGIQEETTYLGVPCITLRSNTERPITVEVGTNELFGNDLAAAKRRGKEILRGRVKSGAVPDQWDGRAAERIASIIVSALYSTSERMP